jgi:mRNA interferase MazF
VPLAQWDLVEANLNPVQGSEQGGIRPVLVVSNDESNRVLPNITVLPLTSTQRRPYPAEIFIPRGAAGQPLDSLVMAHQIRTISQRRVVRHIGSLADSELQRAIQQAIKDHLDLP